MSSVIYFDPCMSATAAELMHSAHCRTPSDLGYSGDRHVRRARPASPGTQEMPVTCERSRAALERIVAEIHECATRLAECNQRYLDAMPEKPLMLVGGEMATWERYAAELQRAVERHRQLLDEYKHLALGHS